jgi:branched-chain amino acid transport system permease protein
MDILIQLFFLGISKGSMWALLAVSFAIIFFTTRTFHIAHGALFAISAYCFYIFVSIIGLPLGVAVLLDFLVAIVFAVLIEVLLYQRLRQRYASGMILLLASLAILITTPAIIAMFFGTDPRFYPDFPIGTIKLGNIAISGAQLGMVGSWVFIGLLFLLLRRTHIGMLIRAVADQELVAQTVGINVSMVRIMAMAIGSILLVPTAILYGYDLGIIPSMGFMAILIASACAIMGGIGSFLGAALSGVIIGLAMNIGVASISSMWRDGIAFAVLILVLLLRPEGILGQRTKRMKSDA